MTCTTYLCLWACLESPLTIVRCVSKGKSMWVYQYLSFMQMFLIIAQSFLAAILNLPPVWAKVTISINSVVVVILYMHFGSLSAAMFPLCSEPWNILGPHVMLPMLLKEGGRDHLHRLGTAVVSEAEAHLGETARFREQQSGPDERLSSQELRASRQQDYDKLEDLLGSALPTLGDSRRQIICESLLAEDLTVDLLVSVACRTNGPQALIQLLDLDATDLNRGEITRIALAAMDMKAPDVTQPVVEEPETIAAV
eukprot:gnl/TRDRNA2_/TRDRNA2_63644_c0_seq1.p1 gnl/TRDRNA2_/TRDRNA2_63644_c0~~gnl/TRDRNA2_/TRDRNA2_63644_c0_seq1.p1  ORF type:complete len:254 (-),score=19.62 gnl/TRDRNA2_/TRDRNA2_63644_c0_seq1:150-911(-)